MTTTTMCYLIRPLHTGDSLMSFSVFFMNDGSPQGPFPFAGLPKDEFHPRRGWVTRLNGGYNGFSIFTTRMGYLKAGLVEGSTAATR